MFLNFCITKCNINYKNKEIIVKNVFKMYTLSMKKTIHKYLHKDTYEKGY